MTTLHKTKIVKTAGILGGGFWYQAHCDCGWWAPNSRSYYRQAADDARNHKEEQDGKST